MSSQSWWGLLEPGFSHLVPLFQMLSVVVQRALKSHVFEDVRLSSY
jgi:hypothetical protein